MKKFFAVIIALFACLTSCSSKPYMGTFNELPESAKTFIVTYYNESDISYIKVEKEGLHNEYEVFLNNGVEITFDYKGNLEEIDCNQYAVPDGIVPTEIVNYVSNHFTNAFIVKYKIEKWGKEVSLNNHLELKFDKNGTFLEIDD